MYDKKMNQDKWKSELELHINFSKQLRESRNKAQLHSLEQAEGWLNSLVTIYFGLGGALMAVAATTKFPAKHNEVLFWVCTLLLVGNGLFVTYYRKVKIEISTNNARTLVLEIEFEIAKAYSMVREKLAGKSIDLKVYEDLKQKIRNMSKQELADSYERGRKIEIFTDISFLTLLLSFYLFVIAATHMTKQVLTFYYVGGVVLLIVMVALSVRSYMNARNSINKQVELQTKIQDLY
jgi:hypothetical protein